ncbi:bacterial Ig-like domain-containing protein [Lactococcus garvieae]|uniref:bacterial Ig-like domain-containing protein n=1 Tax=Lactococcus garvieae TaxID=1363 RepID=UPI0032530CB4
MEKKNNQKFRGGQYNFIMKNSMKYIFIVVVSIFFSIMMVERITTTLAETVDSSGSIEESITSQSSLNSDSPNVTEAEESNTSDIGTEKSEAMRSVEPRSTIAQLIPDPVLAQYIADTYYGGSINTGIDDFNKKRVTNLRIEGLDVKSFDGLSVFTEISNINATGCTQLRDLSELPLLATNSSILAVDLSACGITSSDLPEIFSQGVSEGTRALSRLDLSGNSISDTSFFLDVRIDTLNLGSNLLETEDIQNLLNMPRLYDLALDDNGITDVSAFAGIADPACRIRSLSLNNNSITDISVFKELYGTELNHLSVENQTIDTSTFEPFEIKTPSLIFENPVKTLSGIAYPEDITPVGSYNTSDNIITWNNLPGSLGELNTVSFSWFYESGDPLQSYQFNGTYTRQYTFIQDVILNVHNSSIDAGGSWTAADNFDNATDKFGKPVSFDQITVVGTVDTNTPGSYDVEYSYGGFSSTATVEVRENLILSVPATNDFGSYKLGDTSKILPWNTSNQVEVSASPEKNWDLTVAMAHTDTLFPYVKVGNTSISETPIAVTSGTGDNIVSDTVPNEDFLKVDYEGVTTSGTYTGTLQWQLTPTIKEVQE